MNFDQARSWAAQPISRRPIDNKATSALSPPPVPEREHKNNPQHDREYQSKRRREGQGLDEYLPGGQDRKRYRCSSPSSSLDLTVGRFVDECVDARLSRVLARQQALADIVNGHSTQLQTLDSTITSTISNTATNLDAKEKEIATLDAKFAGIKERMDVHNERLERRRLDISELEKRSEERYTKKRTMEDLQTTVSSLENKYDLALVNVKKLFGEKLKQCENTNQSNLTKLTSTYKTKLLETQEKHSSDMAMLRDQLASAVQLRQDMMVLIKNGHIKLQEVETSGNLRENNALGQITELRRSVNKFHDSLNATQHPPQSLSNIVDDIARIEETATQLRIDHDNLHSEQETTNKDLDNYKEILAARLKVMENSITTLEIDAPLLKIRVAHAEEAQVATTSQINGCVTKKELGTEKKRINTMIKEKFDAETKHRDDRMDQAEKTCRDQHSLLRSEIMRGAVKAHIATPTTNRSANASHYAKRSGASFRVHRASMPPQQE